MIKGKRAGVEAEAVDAKELAAVEKVTGYGTGEAQGVGRVDPELVGAAVEGMEENFGSAVGGGGENAVSGDGLLA